MKRVISVILVLVVALSIAVPAFAAEAEPYAVFNDGENYAVLGEAIESGVIKGYGDGSFRPLATLTRAEFVQMLYEACGGNSPAVGDEANWWEPAAAWLREVVIETYAKGADDTLLRQLISSYYDGPATSFRPDESASVEFMIQMLYIVSCARDGVALNDNLAAYATDWAEINGFGVGKDYSGWRFISSGEFITRIEGVNLIIAFREYLAN